MTRAERIERALRGIEEMLSGIRYDPLLLDIREAARLALAPEPEARPSDECACEYSDCKHRKQPPGSVRYGCECGWWNWIHSDAQGEWECPDCKRINFWFREPAPAGGTGGRPSDARITCVCGKTYWGRPDCPRCGRGQRREGGET